MSYDPLTPAPRVKPGPAVRNPPTPTVPPPNTGSTITNGERRANLDDIVDRLHRPRPGDEQ